MLLTTIITKTASMTTTKQSTGQVTSITVETRLTQRVIGTTARKWQSTMQDKALSLTILKTQI